MNAPLPAHQRLRRYLAHPLLHALFLCSAFWSALALRLYRLGAESFWYDELVSVHLASSTTRDLIAHTARDIHPPGYYLILHAWRRFSAPLMEFGNSYEFLYGFASLFFGILICAAVYTLARKTFGRTVALLALWLTALHPFHIDYAQEVRMYTFGAFIALLYILGVLALLRSSATAHGARWKSVLYLSAAAAAGLYVFYYFVFLLAAAFLITGFLTASNEKNGNEKTRNEKTRWSWITPSLPHRHTFLFTWLASHTLALLLWLPWLPIFWRQATEPPVPPWRGPWQGFSDIAEALTQIVVVYLTGHAFETLAWPVWALLAILCLLTLYGYTKNRQAQSRFTKPGFFPLFLLAAFVLLPPLLIIAASALVTPLFHPRYLFPYQAPLLILIAAALVALVRRAPAAGTTGIVLVIALFGWGTSRIWHQPGFAADDHRHAVAHLAHAWRPGDVILVNAGWIYPAFSVYWPTVKVGSGASLPPPLSIDNRLTTDNMFTWKSMYNQQQIFLNNTQQITLLRSGSVDGSANLGWGQPDADFFPASAQDTITALEQVAQTATGLWHYRIYDTVSDPDQVIRNWLAENGRRMVDMPISGRDFLRLEYYAFPPNAPPVPATPLSITVDEGLRFTIHRLESSPRAGHDIYLPYQIEVLPGFAHAELSASLRLLNDASQLEIQADAPLALPAQPYTHTDAALALPIPVSVPPGVHTLELVIYDPHTLQPLTPTTEGLQVTDGQRTVLGTVEIQLPAAPPLLTEHIARFDYLALTQADFPPRLSAAGNQLPLQLTWTPQESPYRDNYTIQIRLVPHTTHHTLEWRAPLGPDTYPSPLWESHFPVRRMLSLPFADAPPPGHYTLSLGLRRTADDAVIPAQQGWGFRGKEWIVLGDVEITE